MKSHQVETTSLPTSCLHLNLSLLVLSLLQRGWEGQEPLPAFRGWTLTCALGPWLATFGNLCTGLSLSCLQSSSLVVLFYSVFKCKSALVLHLHVSSALTAFSPLSFPDLWQLLPICSDSIFSPPTYS